MDTLLLKTSDITARITMAEVVDICDRTFADLGKGKTINPAKVCLDLGEKNAYPPYQGFTIAMPAYVGWLDAAGMKWVGGFHGKRREMNLPYLTGMIMLLDPRTGEFQSVLEGAHITNMRTGAQTAVALKYLKPGCKLRLGIFGAGMQARTQLAAIAELFEIESLHIYDVKVQASEKFAAEATAVVQGTIQVAPNPQAMAKHSDVLICVTQAKEPFLKAKWIEPGTVVFPMGSYQEIEDEVILRADAIVVDHVEQCLHRGALKALAEHGKITRKHVTTTIGEMAAGLATVQDVQKKRIVCIPIGTGAMDVAVARVIYDKAQQEPSNNLATFCFTD